MSRIFTDGDLVSWEAFVSTGPFGLPDRSSLVFNCLSDPGRRARHVEVADKVDAEGKLLEVPDEELREMLAVAAELP